MFHELTHASFEPASTEAICYLGERVPEIVSVVLNLLPPKQSAIEALPATFSFNSF